MKDTVLRFWLPFRFLQEPTGGDAQQHAIYLQNKRWLRRWIEVYVNRWMLLAGLGLVIGGAAYALDFYLVHVLFVSVGIAAGFGMALMIKIAVQVFKE